MSTVNVNDLKVRLLQLKGVGYDKLLLRDSLQNQLALVKNELVAIDQEVKATSQMIVDVESNNNPNPGEGNVPPVDPNVTKVEPSGKAEETKEPKTTVGPQLPPPPAIGNATPKIPKVKKTSHKIGRRA